MRKLYKNNGYNIIDKTLVGLKPPLIYALSNTDLDYTEITSINEMYLFLSEFQYDNLFIQDRIRELFTVLSWESISNTDKNVLINVSVGDNNTEKVAYLIQLGKTEQEALGILKEKWSVNYDLNKQACSLRFNSTALNLVISKYLTLSDAEDLEHTTVNLISSYLRGIRGVVHRGSTYGLLDYFNSTHGTIYNENGLRENKSYVMQNGDANMDNLVSDILAVLLIGIY